jgi:hypothetical protein
MGARKSKEASKTHTEREVLYITHVEDVQYILFNDGSSVKIKGTYYRWYKQGHPESQALFENFCSSGKITKEKIYLFRR